MRMKRFAGYSGLGPGSAAVVCAAWLVLVMLVTLAPTYCSAGTGVTADAPSSETTYSDRFGVADPHLMFHDTATRNSLLGHMNEAGIGWIRVVFAWPDIEPLDGTWVFTLADQAVRAAREHGVKVLGVLGFAPSWANGGHLDWRYPPTDTDAWKEYVRTVCDRYSEDVAAWEIWNEENIHAFWQPEPDYGAYVDLVKQTTPSIRAADPDGTVVMGGLAGLDPEYLHNCLDAGVADYVDAIAYHPYPETIGPPTGYTPKESLARYLVTWVRSMIMEHTSRPLEIWLTEFGWTTYESAPDAYPQGVDEATQASYMLRSLINYADTGADRVFWYCLWDEQYDLSRSDYNYGLLRNNAGHRPSFNYYSTFERVFGRAVSSAPGAATYSCATPATLEAHAFTLDDGSLALGLWKSDDLNDSLSLTLSSAAYQRPVLIDPSTGHEQAVRAFSRDAGGKVKVTGMKVGKKPVIMRFEKTLPLWFLAEGTTDWGFTTYITLQNPNDSSVSARITYMTGSGLVAGPLVKMPARSQATLFPRDTLGNRDFSTRVECVEGLSIAVDRTMTWNRTGEEAHSSVGVTAPAKAWYFPEGSSKWGFETWLLIQNPGSSQATCQVTYMIEGEGPRTFTKTVPANSRASFDMAADIGAGDASIKVSSSVPVIPERAMYRNGRREGHDSIGTTAPAGDYYLAEGTTAWGFTTYVLVQNPDTAEARVTLTFMTPTGPIPLPAFTMPANSRKTVKVNDVLAGTDFSTRVSGSLPVIAERAMYWDNGTGEACHDSIGVDGPHMTFLLPDGDTSNGRETWTLVQNPNSFDVRVEVTYMTPSGTENVAFADTVPANSRKTYGMFERLPDGRASILVNCKTPGGKIIVERAMYWNNRGAGTDTVGAFSY